MTKFNVAATVVIQTFEFVTQDLPQITQVLEVFDKFGNDLPQNVFDAFVLTLQDQLGGLLGNIKWVGGTIGGEIIMPNGANPYQIFATIATLLNKPIQTTVDSQGRSIYTIKYIDTQTETLNISYRNFSNTAGATLQFDFKKNGISKTIKFRLI